MAAKQALDLTRAEAVVRKLREAMAKAGRAPIKDAVSLSRYWPVKR